VYKAIERCSIPVVDGLVEVDIADMLYKSRTRARANPRRDPPPPPAEQPEGHVSYDDARRRREAAEAAIAELKLATLAGSLVLREELDRSVFSAGRVMRDQLLSMAPRLAASLAPISDAKAIELRIAEEMRIALRAFAQQLRSGGMDGDGQPS
jgi:hypothetical protein